MCGRFALYQSPDDVQDHFSLDDSPELSPSYNIAPGTNILGIAYYENSLVPMFFRWGLIPHWSKAKQTQYRMINARIETVWDKPSFRSAIRYRRCLIPASGFYEWKKAGPGKQPYFISVSGSSMFAISGMGSIFLKMTVLKGFPKLPCFFRLLSIRIYYGRKYSGIHICRFFSS